MWRLEEYGIFTQLKQQEKQAKKMIAGHVKQVAKKEFQQKWVDDTSSYAGRLLIK